jgi:hypothetical protein
MTEQRVNRVLLAGVGRSGTTWTGRILGCAADTAYMNEPDNVGINHASAAQSDTLGFGPFPVLRPGQSAPQYAALWRMAYAGRLPMRVGAGRKVARLGLRLPRAVRDPLLTAFARALAGTGTPPRNVVVKSTMTPFALEWIVENFQPKVVVIQRNPLNVVSSWLEWRVLGKDLHTRPAVRERYDELIGQPLPQPGDGPLALTAWSVGLLTTIFAHLTSDHPEWHLITHEELCDDPRGQFHTLYDKLGLTWTDESERFLERGYLPPSFARSAPAPGSTDPAEAIKEQPHRWKERLSEEQVAEIETILDQFPTRGWVRAPEVAQTA